LSIKSTPPALRLQSLTHTRLRHYEPFLMRASPCNVVWAGYIAWPIMLWPDEEPQFIQILKRLW